MPIVRAPAVALVACLLAPSQATAAPNEIKVFSDELAGYGESTLETHGNKASRAGRRSEIHAVPFQVMPEYSCGIWKNWEVSVQLPLSISNEHGQSDGYRAELQYIAPHSEETGYYWGFNVEAARLARPGDATIWNIELIPILGYRLDRWHLIANPGLSRPMSGPQKRTNFEPAYKASYRTTAANQFGAEFYEEAGPLRRMLTGDRRYRVLYLAWDGKIGKSDINVGVGRGLNNASDRFVFKTVFEFAF